MSVVGVLDATLAAGWSLGFEDLALLNAKPAGTRLGFAAQLMMYRMTGRFGRVAASSLTRRSHIWLSRSERRSGILGPMTGLAAPGAATVPRSWLTLGFAARGGRTCGMRPPGPDPNCAHWHCRLPR